MALLIFQKLYHDLALRLKDKHATMEFFLTKLNKIAWLKLR